MVNGKRTASLVASGTRYVVNDGELGKPYTFQVKVSIPLNGQPMKGSFSSLDDWQRSKNNFIVTRECLLARSDVSQATGVCQRE